MKSAFVAARAGKSTFGAVIVVLLMLWPIAQTRSADKEISEMTLSEILDLVERLPAQANASTGSRLTKRLIELAFFEYGVGPQEREGAEILAASFISAIEESLGDRPKALAAFRDAYAFQLSQIPLLGVGSLAWEIGRPDFPAEDVVPLILAPESGALIPSLIKTIHPDDWRAARPEIIEALIRDRRRPGESNVVLILAGLIAARDAVAWNFLTPDERIRLAQVSTNYGSDMGLIVRWTRSNSERRRSDMLSSELGHARQRTKPSAKTGSGSMSDAVSLTAPRAQLI